MQLLPNRPVNFREGLFPLLLFPSLSLLNTPFLLAFCFWLCFWDFFLSHVINRCLSPACCSNSAFVLPRPRHLVCGTLPRQLSQVVCPSLSPLVDPKFPPVLSLSLIFFLRISPPLPVYPPPPYIASQPGCPRPTHLPARILALYARQPGYILELDPPCRVVSALAYTISAPVRTRRYLDAAPSICVTGHHSFSLPLSLAESEIKEGNCLVEETTRPSLLPPAVFWSYLSFHPQEHRCLTLGKRHHFQTSRDTSKGQAATPLSFADLDGMPGLDQDSS